MLVKLENGDYYINHNPLEPKTFTDVNGFEWFDKELGNAHQYEDMIGYFTDCWLTALQYYQETGNAYKSLSGELNEQLKRAYYMTELSSATECEEVYKAREGFTFRPYQNAGIKYCLMADNVLIADNMRLGKTATSLGVVNELKARKVLILCPATLKDNWLRECQQVLIGDLTYQVLTSQSEYRDCNVTIVNYDILHIVSGLYQEEFDVIIADEIHCIKNNESQRSEYAFQLRGKKKLGLTGTPLLNGVEDYITILSWLDPFWEKFIVKHGRVFYPSGKEIQLSEIQSIARSYLMLRRVQSQVFSMEPLYKRYIHLPVTEEIKKLIEEEKSTTVMARGLALGVAKVPFTLRHIDNLLYGGKKIVVFARHREVISQLSTALGTRAVTVSGSTTTSQRMENVRKFQTDDNCQVFIGSIVAAGVGINLSVADHIIFVEFDWTPGLMEQAEERCSDSNQKKEVVIDRLVYEGSSDYNKLINREGKEENITEGTDILYALN